MKRIGKKIKQILSDRDKLHIASIALQQQEAEYNRSSIDKQKDNK